MSTEIPPTPPSPGVGLRRKPKTLPTLPLSAFSPPNSSTGERFPRPPTPSRVHPVQVVDAHVVVVGDATASLESWKKEAGKALGGLIGKGGVVLALPATASDELLAGLQLRDTGGQGLPEIAGVPVLSLMVPFEMHSAQHEMPAYTSGLSIPISLATSFSKSTPESIVGLKWALSQGRPVDIDVRAALSDSALQGFLDLLDEAVADLPSVPPIIISSVLPPPHDLSLSIVKLMKHPSYHTFQTQTAALSLVPGLYIKFLPPSWDAPTPATPSDLANDTVDDANSKQSKEWKRRIKMYLGPVIEAFGFERIIFGSSPSPASHSASLAGDWYEIARESLAELGADQETQDTGADQETGIDLVFASNAEKVYGNRAKK
ncbi:hypothetical protein DFH07DRAFT_293653 [Mycena maculata]|uniref:Uncharacterized protein n=1 Tax=Mycena maculata TaxID=230809 RepID=A0AAD7MLG8_9AGAR|nr:hypothetical protein DFH07DRAFT_293653 [Mycena maculata]